MERQYLKTAGAKVCAATVIAALALPTMAYSDQVQLVSYDGSAQFVGQLLAYDDGRYRINTELGVLLIYADVVRCEGATCPPLATVYADIFAANDIVPDQKIRPIGAASH